MLHINLAQDGAKAVMHREIDIREGDVYTCKHPSDMCNLFYCYSLTNSVDDVRFLLFSKTCILICTHSFVRVHELNDMNEYHVCFTIVTDVGIANFMKCCFVNGSPSVKDFLVGTVLCSRVSNSPAQSGDAVPTIFKQNENYVRQRADEWLI